ncbi:MAG: spore coat protein [Lachnospiraceae bacterium]|nr:spore coat protein [Lachnospiraceae bacterium]MEE1014682.1 spore coat protein [Lachnospiraceae bacterium]
MQQVYTDKEVLNDGLCAQKASTGKFNMAANECVHSQVRDTMLNILEQEHSIQYDVFNMMHKRGFYETPAAEDKKVSDAKMKYAQSVK